MTTESARAARSPERRSLENSEQEFLTRYAEFAASGTLHPQIEGSPLMEFAAAGRVLYLFDRTGPYRAHPGPARVLVHGVVEASAWEALSGQPQQTFTMLGASEAEGVGEIIHVSRRSCVVQARLPIVLSSFEPLPTLQVGDWVKFRTLPPLHGFLLE
ncbi:hypothetical protein [Deinococcus cavernae]|uniref:hypothetical protein n=1 Tax=Deinococcus cavernae TaxID=2320857 RepID=UPI001F3ECC1D|nr:hypothetical protein [Deinococcus cavernae]